MRSSDAPGAPDTERRSILQTKILFTKNPSPTQKIAGADGLCFLFKNEGVGDKTNFDKEAEDLALYLRLIFPRRTLYCLKKYL